MSLFLPQSQIWHSIMLGIALCLWNGCKPAAKPATVNPQVYELRMQAPGHNIKTTYVVDMAVKASTGRENQSVLIKTQMDCLFEVIEPATATTSGKAKCRFTRIAYDMNGKKLASDTTGETDPRLAPVVAELQQVTREITIDTTYDRNFKVIKATPISEATLNRFTIAKSMLAPYNQESSLVGVFVGSQAMLPDHPVKVGDRWQVAAPGNPNLPPELNAATTVTLASVSQEGTDTIACLNAKSLAKIDSPKKMRNPTGEVITINQGTMKTEMTTRFNITQQREESSTGTIRTIFEIPHPQGGGLTIKNDTEMKINTQRAYDRISKDR
jgi:hypothetical protein